MSILAMNVHQRHQNDDGSAIVEVDVTTETGDGVLTFTLTGDDQVTGTITGTAGLIPLGLWDQQGTG